MKLSLDADFRTRTNRDATFLRPAHDKRSLQGSRDEENMFDFTTHWAYALVGTAVALVTLLAISVYVIIKRRRKATSPLTPDSPKQSTFQCPPLTIELSTTQQQPLPEHMGRTAAQPIRIKARGLLERRGSSASLTIELNQPDSSFHCGTPPKECSAEEYLTSAGNRLTRRQLRDCIKNPKALQQEFIDIPLNHPGKLDLPGCSNKNRYKSIWPNQSTRVRLPAIPSDPSSSYINANYIRGYDAEPKAFVATQGPLPNTINDFWQAVWYDRVPCIVMMTKLKENNKTKCEPYLPTVEAAYGTIRVSVLSTVARNGYYLRSLVLKKDQEMRQVKHYWFTAWPDHKAPVSTARQLLAFAQEVEAERDRVKQNSPDPTVVGPVLVHCSAGLGRSGCFIGTCIGIKQLAEENMVDLLGIVCQMRLDRGGLIQTPEQYEFLHHAVVLFEKDLPETPTSATLPLTSSSSDGSKRTSPT